MCPKNLDPPTAMTEKKGNLLTSDKAIKTEHWRLIRKDLKITRLNLILRTWRKILMSSVRSDFK